ncbi:transcriptional regulator, MutR family [Streptococcus pyogenes NS88.2]|nr:transcriptional regulator, MutR family [Streptococcus pyogenes NS88.2]
MNSYQKVRHFVTTQDSDGLKQLLHAQLASTDKKEMFTDIFLAYPACLSLLWHAILGVPHATLSVALLQRIHIESRNRHSTLFLSGLIKLEMLFN